jgi:uroporphyrinogen III methyltransferase/synthase
MKARGAEVMLMPTVRFESPEDPSALDEALSRLAQFDWLLFTSQNAVRFVSKRLAEIFPVHDTLKPAPARVAAVGPATARAAQEHSWKVDYVSEHHDGESLAEGLAAEGFLFGKRVLLPRSDRADARLPQALRNAHARVTEVIAYRTLTIKARDAEMQSALLRGEADAIVFASPSAFHNFCDSAGTAEVVAIGSRVVFVALGPTTSAAIRAINARVALESHSPSVESVVDSLCEYFADTGTAQGRAAALDSAPARPA